jgi:hypothetical protein
MAEETREVQGIDWRRCFAFLEILRSFRMAIHPVKLLLCFLGVAASFGAAVLVDQLPAPIGQTHVSLASAVPDALSDWDLSPLAAPEGRSFYGNVHHIVTDTLWGQWSVPYVGGHSWGGFATFAASPLSAAYESINLIIAYWREATWFALINTVLSLALWALIGTAVARMASVRIAREEGVPLKKALGFAAAKWPSAVASPLIPFGVLVLLALLIGVPTGLFTMIPYIGEVVAGLFWGLSLLFCFLLALVFVGGVFSVGLQWPTIAAEGSDSFDAISRSISYISSRPWRYLFYTAFAAAYGCLTFVLVKFVTFLTLMIAHTSVGTFTFNWGTSGTMSKLDRLWAAPQLLSPWPHAGMPPEQMANAESLGSYLMVAWVWVVLGLMVAFLFSFFFTSQTVVYFLLRRTVDATDIEEVYMEESEEEGLPLEHPVEEAEVLKPVEDAGPPAPASGASDEPQPPE